MFADDTATVGAKEEMEGGVNVIKEVMGKFEERSNDQKEECLDFCMEESESIRVVGSWVGTKEQLKYMRFSKKWQARIVQACVESVF